VRWSTTCSRPCTPRPGWLAAPQIGVLQRVLVLDTRPRQPEVQPVVMINPLLVSTEGGLSVYREGCLSIPGEAEEVERPAVVTVEFLDVEGQLRQPAARAAGHRGAARDRPSRRPALYVDFLPVLQRLSMRRRAKRRKLERPEAAVQSVSTAL
jgi:peptide deformylase